MDADVDSLSMTNNTINRSLVNNCRGFTFTKSYSTARSMNFNLTLTSNTFVGKSLNSNLGMNIVQSSDDTLNDAEVKN